MRPRTQASEGEASETPTGGAAEDAVAARLVSEGWRVRGRRVRLGRLEIDVVAQKGDVVACVEVRGRRADALVSAADSVDWKKRRALGRAAQRLWRRLVEDPTVRVVRIDLATVTFGPGGARVEIHEGAIPIP